MLLFCLSVCLCVVFLALSNLADEIIVINLNSQKGFSLQVEENVSSLAISAPAVESDKDSPSFPSYFAMSNSHRNRERYVSMSIFC